MANRKIILDINDQPSKWYEVLMKQHQANDFIILTQDDDELIWFITNYTQYLCRSGNNEVIALYGNCIKNIADFTYQLNRSMPVGYKMGARLEVIYDVLLNFETEPIRRSIIWHDADFLFRSNRALFGDLFELMIVAAYVNRAGISTLKEDGKPYQVDQRNIFVFNATAIDEINSLLSKAYYIPGIDGEGKSNKVFDFNIVEIMK